MTTSQVHLVAGAKTDVSGVRVQHRWRAAGAGVLAGLLAMIGSWHPSLWSDEAATISAASRSVHDLWRMVGNIDLVHGTYYLMMHFWTGIFGTDAFALRLPSALFVALAGACVYLLGLRLGGSALAAVGAAVFAVLPRVSWAGMEGRSFGLTALLAAGATLLLMMALDTGKSRLWTAYAALLALGILVNLFFGLLVLAHLVSLIWTRSETNSRWVHWSAAVVGAGLLTSVFVIRSVGQAGQLGERSFGLLDLGQNVLVNQWFLGDTPTTTTGVSTTNISIVDLGSWWMPAAVLLAAVGWVVMLTACVSAWRTRRELAGRRSPVAWAVPWMVVPTAIIGGYSLIGTPIYSSRYLTFAAPAVAILVAAGLLAVSNSRIRIGLVVVMLLLATPIYISQRGLNAKNGTDWLTVSQYIGTHAAPGDGVYFVPRYDVPGPVVGQTSRGVSVAYPGPFRGLIDLTLVRTPAAAANLAGESRRLAASTTQLTSVQTVWVVQRKDYPADSARDDAQIMTKSGFRETGRWTGTLDVVLRFTRSR